MCCTNTAEVEDREMVDFMLAARRYFNCGSSHDAVALQGKLEAAYEQVEKAFEEQVELLCSTEYEKDSGSESCSCAKQEQLPQQQSTSQKVKYHIVILA